jgi:hypothetical protein
VHLWKNIWEERRRYRSQWPCFLRCRSEASWLRASWVRIPPREFMFVSCVVCSVVSGLWDEVITGWEESYLVCDCVLFGASTMRGPRSDLGSCAKKMRQIRVSGQVLVPASLWPGKEPQTTIEYEAGPQSFSGRFGGRDISLFPARNLTMNTRSSSPYSNYYAKYTITTLIF